MTEVELDALYVRITRSLEASTRREVVDPYVLALAAYHRLVCERITAQDAVEDAAFADVECEMAVRRYNITDARLRRASGLPISARRIAMGLGRLGDHDPYPDWQERVLARLPRVQIRSPWHRRLWRWMTGR